MYKLIVVIFRLKCIFSSLMNELEPLQLKPCRLTTNRIKKKFGNQIISFYKI